jgi:hypothetical protein
MTFLVELEQGQPSPQHEIQSEDYPLGLMDPGKTWVSDLDTLQ